MKTRLDNNVTDRIDVVYIKKKLSCHDLLDQVQFVTKTRLDNDVIDQTGAVYAENKIELS